VTNRVEIFKAVANKVALDKAEQEVRDCTRAVYARANVLTPVDTGNLRAHNRMLPTRRAATKVTSGVENRARYAAAVHDGAKAHTIRARRKKALRFRVGGKTVIVRQVRHPGNRGRPWLTRALREVAPPRGFRVTT
jgi:hypothetical protein